MAKDLSRNHKDLTEDEATVLLTRQLQQHQHHNAGWYRVHAVRGLTGGHRLLPKINATLKQVTLTQTGSPDINRFPLHIQVPLTQTGTPDPNRSLDTNRYP